MHRTLKALPFVLAAVLSIVLAVAAASASAVAANASVKHTRMQTWCADTAAYFKVPDHRNLDNLVIASLYIAPRPLQLDTLNILYDRLDGSWAEYGPGELAVLRQDFTEKCELPMAS